MGYSFEEDWRANAMVHISTHPDFISSVGWLSIIDKEHEVHDVAERFADLAIDYRLEPETCSTL